MNLVDPKPSRVERLRMWADGEVLPLSFHPSGNTSPLLASAATRWSGLPFELHDMPAFDGPWDSGPLPGERGMLIIVDGLPKMSVQCGRQEIQIGSPPGSVFLRDGDQRRPVKRSFGHGQCLALNISAVWNERLLAEGGPVSFAGVPGIPPSEVALSIASAMRAEVASGAASGALFAESLSLALLCHLIERLAPTPMRVRGSLTTGQRQRLSRYIDDRIQNDLTLAELANVTGLGARHFSSLFREAFGMSPHRYLIARRLARGARLLETTRTEIAEVALSLGFSSQSHFATAFRKQYGMTPRKYALSRRRSSIAGS